MKDTLLVVDIGNTNTVFGLIEPNQKEITFHKRTITRLDRTSDELGVFLKGFVKEDNYSPERIGKAIYSSVVPAFNPIVERMIEDWLKIKPICVNYQMNLPFTILYPRPFEIGADRLVNATAVSELYGGNYIIIDMGTATTFCVLNKSKEYLGGLIAPGLKNSMESLTKKTAQLPSIIFQPPKKVITGSTIESLQSGFFYGWVGLLEGIITEIKKEVGSDYKVIGTGGLVTTIYNVRKGIFDVVDPLLTLKGLDILYQMNK